MNHIITKKLTGFNLVELMIVLSILALITAVAITNYISYSKKAAVITASTLADNIKSKVMLYYTDQEQFPSLANGNATEINNSFNVSVLDANTKKYVSNTTFYSFSDASTPTLPPSITAQLSIRANILGYIKIDLNPDQKLSKDPTVAAQIFLVASEISNSVSLNSLPEKIEPISYDTPHIILTASESQIGTQITWTRFSVGIPTPLIPPGSIPSCSANQVSQSGNCAPCAAGSYPSISTDGTNICAPCELGKYSAAGAPSCTACGGGTYTPAVGSSSCINCGIGIATCDATNGAATACISSTATASYNLTGPSGVAGTVCNVTCSGATYTLNNACQACPSTCSACTSTTCSSCTTGYYGTNCGSSVSSCAGYLTGSGVSAICSTCPPHAACSGGAITGCLAGYYGSNGICTSCTSAIVTGCDPSTGGATSCTVGYQLSATSGAAGTTCIIYCPIHAICNSSGGITGCLTGYYGTNCSSSVSSCNGVMSGSGVTATCNACPINAVCSGGVMTGCQSGKYLYNNACYTSCPNGSFLPGIGTTCYPCSSGCITCYASNYCTTCDTGNGYYLYNNNCVTSCPTGYTPSGSSCIPACNGYTYNGTCYSSCPTATFPDSTIGTVTSTCYECSVIRNCATCTGVAPNPVCTQCNSVNTPSATYPDLTPSNYWPVIYLKNGSCVQWCDSGQYLVISTNTCVNSCPAGTTTNNSPYGANGVIVASGSCSPGCPSGYYLSGGNCTSCTSAIITGCSSSTGGATSCTSGYRLSGTSGASGTSCVIACSANCVSCTDSTHCSTCMSGWYVYNGACVTPCPGGTYISGNNCTPCATGVITGTCSGTTNYTCGLHAYMSGNYCVCNIGYYNSTNDGTPPPAVCNNCPPFCGRGGGCSSRTTCSP